MNIIDSIVGFFNPKAGLARVQARTALEKSVRRYEGAADGRRHSSWLSKNNPSVNETIAKDIKKLVSRSRELAINNPYAKKAPCTISNNVVGTGILAKPYYVPTIQKGIKKNTDKKTLELINECFKQWSSDLSADYDNNFNFYGLQYLAMRTIVTSGEVLAIRKKVKVDVNKFGLQILLIEADYIDTTKHTETDTGGGFTQYGIKYSKENKKLGYYIYDRHPSENKAKSEFVDIKDIIHCFDVERPGQNRGVPLASSTLLTQRDLDDYNDAELVGKKVAASYAVFVQKDDLDDSSASDEEEPLEHVEPGSVNFLRKGETVSFASPPQNQGFSDFVKKQHQGIAVGYNMTYEQLTGDLSNVNFSSYRAGSMEFSKQVFYWQYQMLITKFCDVVFKWFIDALRVAVGIKPDVEIKAEWTAPRREMLDPLKETNAKKNQMRSGLVSWQEMVRQDGYDPAQVLKEIAEDFAAFKGAGVTAEWSPYFEQIAKANANANNNSDDSGDGNNN